MALDEMVVDILENDNRALVHTVVEVEVDIHSVNNTCHCGLAVGNMVCTVVEEVVVAA